MILPSAYPRKAFFRPYNNPAMKATAPIRPFKIARDLPAVTDLLEICFARPDDEDSRRYIASMRRAARDTSFLRWASNAAQSSLPLRGFVWEEDGKIVGNVNLAVFRHRGQRIYLIVNVAVHPRWRRRGIARRLVQSSMQLARQKGASAIWLQVREDNPGAIRLYEQLGFITRATRTIWSLEPAYKPLQVPAGTEIAPRKFSDWQQQKRWLAATYPPLLAWFFSPDWQRFSPWPWDVAWQLLHETHVRQWRVSHQGQLQAVVTWVAANNRRDMLWLAAPPQAQATALATLFLYIQQKLSTRLEFRLDIPARHHRAALQAAGFTARRTLLWMQAA